MRSSLSVPLLLIAFYMTFATCERYGDDLSGKRANSLLSGSDSENLDSDENSLEKRHERYAFGLGRRSYVLTANSQGKRLPSYDFGLGKRSRPYSFGLGKRTFEEDYPESEYGYNNWLASNIDDNTKRGRPYSFGLGKRSLIKSNDQRYNFGLGKR